MPKFRSWSIPKEIFLYIFNFFNNLFKYGVIHIVRTHKGGGEGSSQMRTIACKGDGGFKVAYVRIKNFFWTTKSFVQKKLLHCHLLLCIEKCKPALKVL